MLDDRLLLNPPQMVDKLSSDYYHVLKLYLLFQYSWEIILCTNVYYFRAVASTGGVVRPKGVESFASAASEKF